MAGIRELAVEFREALAASDPGVSAGEACAEIAEELARTEKACAAARVRYAARASECGEHRKRGFADASDWMARSAGSTAGEARAALGTEKAVDACPATKEALAAGEVSLAQAREIASVPDHEAELLDLARTSGSVRSKTRHASCDSRRSIPRNCSPGSRARESWCTGKTTSA